MKILFITQAFPPTIGGMELYSYEVVSRISFKHEAVVMCPKESAGIKAGKAKIVPCLNRGFVSQENLGRLVATLRKEKPDVVHILGASCSFLALVIKYISGKPVIVTCHGVDFISPWGAYFFSRDLEELMSAGLSFCDRIITVSHYTEARLAGMGIPKRKIRVVFNGVDTRIFRPKKPAIKIDGVHKGDRVLLTVSRIDPRKGIAMVIKSMRQILKAEPNLKYVIVGNIEGVPDTFVREKIFLPYLKAAGLEKNVIYAGGITDKKVLAEYYNACDIFIMVPEEIKKGRVVKSVESFGIVYLEANACAKPVIASRSGGIADAVIHGKTGLLIGQKNAEEAARAVIALLRDEHLRKKIGLYGKRRAEKYFSWGTNVRQLSSIYAKCPNRYSRKRVGAYLKKFRLLPFLA